MRPAGRRALRELAALSQRAFGTHQNSLRWEFLKSQGHIINPCNSKLHPSYVDAKMAPEGDEETSMQEAYNPESRCFGCGPAAEDGLQLRSFRIRNGLEARTRLAPRYQAFPGIVQGGIVSALLDCHGNWTAAVALMDRAGLSRPPLTLTAEILVTYKEPTPPGEELVVRSQVNNVKDGEAAGSGKASVLVDLTLHQVLEEGREKLLVSGMGIFKKLGALRAL